MSNNYIELLLQLGVSKDSSLDNINKGIESIEKDKRLKKLDVELGVSDKSLNNINEYIKTIQDKINELDVSLDVKGGNGNNKLFEQMEKQINSLQNKIKELEKALDSVAFGGNSGSDSFKGFNKEALSAMNSVKQLKDFLTESGYAVNIDFDVDENGERKVKRVIADIKHASGEIEKIKISPTFNEDGSIDFKLLEESMKNTNFKGFEENQEMARRSLEELGRQGKLTAKDIEDYSDRIENAKTNLNLEKAVRDMKDLNKEMSHSTKWANAENNIKSQAEASVQALEKLKQSTKESAIGYDIDTSKIDELINKMKSMSNIKILNDTQITEANNEFSLLSKQFSSLKNDSASFETALRSINNALNTAGNQGLITQEKFEELQATIRHLTMDSDLPMEEKLRRVKAEAEKLNATLSDTKHFNKMSEGAQKALNEVDKLGSMLTKTENSYKRTVNKEDVADVRKELERLANVPVFTNEAEVKAYNQELKKVENQIRQINSAATVGARNSLGVIDSLKVALEKFPIWMLSSTIFFGAVRGVKDLTDKVIELDTAMVNLMRVSDGSQFEFDKVIERSIDNVTELSGKLGDYMELVNEFARTGKTIDESFDLANTTQTLMNISELTASESVDSLTASMISFGIAAEDSARIADKLNEVDNNFSITTKDLSQAMNKASSTAKTFGVDLDTLLGHVTAIGSATRESGNIVGNSLKSIYARITTNENAVGALSAIGIGLEKMDGSAKSSAELIDEVANKWDGLSEAQQRNTAVGVAGIYQLSRFNALMLNYDTAISATETSLNSYGSAMREQEKYNQSLEARLNRLSTAWYGFADALGDTVVYDALVVGTTALEKMTNIADNSTGSTLALSTSLGLMVAPLTLLSSRFTAFSSDLIKNTLQRVANTQATKTGTASLIANQIATVRNSIATKGLTGSLLALATSSTAAGVAIRSALMMTGVGIAIAGVTTAITILTSKISENIRKQEEFDQYLNKNKEALTSNAEQVDTLLKTYNAMSESNQSTWDTEQQEKYIGVQNQLAELFPSIISYVDENGNAHLKSKEAIAEEIKLTNELIQAEKDMQKLQAQKTFKDSLDDVNSISRKRNTLEKSLTAKYNNHSTEEAAKIKLELLKFDKEISNKTEEIRSSVLSIADAFTDAGESISSTINNHIISSMDNIDFSKLNSVELEAFAKSLAEIRIELNNAFSDGNIEGINLVNQNLVDLINSSGGLKPNIDNVSISTDKLAKSVENAKNATANIDDEFGEFGSSAEVLAKKIEELYGNMSALSSAEEQLAGVSSKAVDDSNELLFLYEQLSNQLSGYTDAQIKDLYEKERLSAEEKNIIKLNEQRADIITLLNVLYPQYTKLQEDQISLTYEQVEAMKQEEKASKVLLEAYKLARDGKLSAEQQMTVASAQATKARIDNIKKEIQALNILNQELQKYISDSTSMNDDAGKASMRASMIQANNNSAISDRTSELDNLQSQLNSTVGTIESFTSAINDSEKSSKKSNETTKSSIYITDKYKQSLEALNLEIEKQQKLRAKEPDWSEKYRKSLEAQIKLEKQKLELQKQQAESLKSQIKSGKIQQTGMINSSSKSSSATTQKNLNGWSGSITSGYGMRMHPTLGVMKMHDGIDIAGKKGTRLDANVGGKVISQGYNDVSGNFVKIEDSNGFKHLYAHLEKAFVKIGDLVEAGTQIGNIGSTGRSTGSHLHYEIKNSSGNYINPSTFVNSAKNNKVSSTTSSSGDNSAAELAQALDQAKSTLISIENDIMSTQALIDDLEEQVVNSYLSKYNNRRDSIEKQLSFEDAKIRNLDKTSARYAKTQEYQASLLEKKQVVNQEELKFIEDLIASGTLSSVMLAEMKTRTKELMTAIEALNTEMGRLALDKIYNDYELILKKENDSLDTLEASIEQLDKNSLKYAGSLEKVVSHLRNKHNANQQEINDLQKLISSGKLQGEILEEAKDKVQALTLSMQKLKVEMSDTNFEIIVNIKTRYDEEIDDLQFEIDRSKTIQGMYTDGSADAANEIKKQISWYEKMAEAYDTSRRKLKEELKQRELLPERIKEITELMEDETNAYWNTRSAIDALNKELEETNKRMLEDIANQLISAYKEYVQERRDEHMEMLDKEAKAEDDAHKKRMKQLQDEMDLFRKNVEEKIRLIDRAEAERDYNMEIDDMETERDKLVDQINLLSLDDSHGAKSKKKKLLEQLDKLDKDIAEKRHDRDIDLQKQALSDLLDTKEEEMSKKEELLDEEYQATVNSLDAQKKYWEKYYTDLLNDERKFASIREDIMNGHFEKVANEFQGYIQEMINTMPLLSDTMNGTMQSVGTAIRQNVIDNLNEAIKKMQEFQSIQLPTNSIKDDFEPNTPKDTSYNGDTSSNAPTGNNSNSGNTSSGYKNINQADLKVLLGKFIRENVAPQAPQGTERDSVKYKGDTIAAQGRSEGSQISPDESLSQALGKLDKDGMTSLSNYATYSFAGITSDKYKNMILKWSNDLRRNAASLDTGGMLNFSGQGMDGKGGRFIVAHPNEVVMNPIEVDKLVKSTSVLDNIMKMINPVISKFPSFNSTNNSAPSGGDLNININGTIQNSSNRDAKMFANEVANEMRTRGMWK